MHRRLERLDRARRRVRTAALACGIALVALTAAAPAWAADPCDPKGELVGFPWVEQLAPCLVWLRDGLGHREPLDRVFVRRLLVRVLSPGARDREARASLESIPPIPLADLVALLDDPALLDDVIDFALMPRPSARDARDRALARLYVLRAPGLLDRLAARPEKDRNALIERLAKGLVALLFPHLDAKNAARMIVGVHWELAQQDHPQHGLAERVEEAVLAELE